MGYLPIENYGIIGNMRTVALVGINGSIDWLCLPRIDSPSVFASVLDDKKGGYFKIAPVGQGASEKQLYWPRDKRPDHPLLVPGRGRRGQGLYADRSRAG